MGLGGMVALDGWKRTKGCEGEQVAIGDGILWATPCKRGEAERSLEPAAAKAMSLGGSVVAKISDYIHRRASAIPQRLLLTAVHSRSFFGGADVLFSSIPVDISK